MTRLLIVATAALALASCAPGGMSSRDRAAVAETDRPCFLSQTMVNFRSDDDTTVYVRAGRNAVFELRTGFCRGLNSARSLAISGNRTCTGETVDLAVSGPSLTNENNSVCRAEVARQLTPDEVAALPARLRP